MASFEEQIAIGEAKKNFILEKGHALFAIQLNGILQESVTIAAMIHMSTNPDDLIHLQQWEENCRHRIETILTQVEKFSGEMFTL